MRQQRDSMVFRFRGDPYITPELESEKVDSIPLSVVRVLSEFEFINEFKRPPGHQYWQTIDFMQTTLKITSLSGLGKQYNFTFNAPNFKISKQQAAPKNDHPCGVDDNHDEETDPLLWPPPPIVEHGYDGKIEFNFKQFGGNGSSLDELQLMIS